MNKYDHDLLRKIEKIRGILAQSEQKHHSTDHLTKQTYDFVKERLRVDSGQAAFQDFFNSIDYSTEDTSRKLILERCPGFCPSSGHTTNYYDLAQDLRQRITSMKIKIDRQLGILAALKDRVKDQVVEMQRLEVRSSTQKEGCSANRPQWLKPRRETEKTVQTCGYKSEFVQLSEGAKITPGLLVDVHLSIKSSNLFFFKCRLTNYKQFTPF